MKYVLAPSNTFQRFIFPGEIVKFSDRCQTTAKRMTTEEAAEYGVSKLQLVSPPAFDPLTQKRIEDDPLLVGGVWVQQWQVSAMVDADEIVVAQQQARDVAKVARTAAVEAITVTTAAGNTFDGDETSQGRMARAVIALQATATSSITWVLSDNTVIEATAAELTEALALAGAAQAAVWVIA